MGRKPGGKAKAREVRRKEEGRRTASPRLRDRRAATRRRRRVEEPDGRRGVRSIEVTSGHYASVQMAQKCEGDSEGMGSIPGSKSREDGRTAVRFAERNAPSSLGEVAGDEAATDRCRYEVRTFAISIQFVLRRTCRAKPILVNPLAIVLTYLDPQQDVVSASTGG